MLRTDLMGASPSPLSPLPIALTAMCATLFCHIALAAPPDRLGNSDDLPALDSRHPIYCVPNERSVPVRLQCDTPATGPGVCLVAPDCLEGIGSEAESQCTRIARTHGCTWSDAERTYATFTAEHTVRPARADAEDGWWRDAEGRIFQVEFDMNQRFWLGARWLGTWGDGGASGIGTSETGGVGIDMGFRADVLAGDLRTKTRYRFLEADLTLAPFALRARLLEIDSSSDGDEPFLRVTTFVGEPARHDLYVTAGWWGELMAIELSPRGSRDDAFMRIAAAGLTWDLWHSPDMTSYLRLRGGVAIDDVLHTGSDARIAFTPLAYLEGDFIFDDAGFHRLVFSTGYEAIYIGDGDQPGTFEGHARFQNELAYELILLAINDQPMSLRVGLQGGWRDDLQDADRNGWDVTAMAGLRFSLWAPAPDRDERARAAARHSGAKP